MIKLYNTYRQHGVHILGIALEVEESMGQDEFVAWCRDNKIEWPQLYSGRGWEHPVAKKFHIRGIPELIFIDKAGKVAGEGRAHDAMHWICEELDLPLPEECRHKMNGKMRR